MNTFDSYLQERGFGNGTMLSPSQARSAYTEYQSAAMPAAIVAAKQSQPAAAEQSSSNPMMGAATGIGMKYATGAGGGGGGGGGNGMVAGWGGAASGAASGFMAGHYVSQTDPNLSNQKDGFGKNWQDRRAYVGGAILGGVMGYYGLGSLAGPATVYASKFMEPATRSAIKWGDSWGGAGGALMVDPIGSVASGKYSTSELAKGALLGPFAKVFK